MQTHSAPGSLRSRRSLNSMRASHVSDSSQSIRSHGFRRRPSSVSRSQSKHRLITPWSQFKHVVFGTWVNIGLGCVPAGFAVYYTNVDSVTVFCINFIAIVPCSMTLSFCVEQFGLYMGDVMRGLVTITAGNMVQLISSILLLKGHQIEVLRSSLLGSVLSNLLFMTGIGFFVGGYNRPQQYFNVTLVRTISMFLQLAALSLLIPTVAYLLADVSPADVAAQSRGTAVIVIISYALYLFFQLKTNRLEYGKPQQRVDRIKKSKDEGETIVGIARIAAGSAAGVGGHINSQNLIHQELADQDDDKGYPVLSITGSLIGIIMALVLIGFLSEFATNRMQGLCQASNLSQRFVGLVILPILSYEVEPIIFAWNDKMNLSITLTLERCMQTALLVIPVVVLTAWGMGVEDMTLEFDSFTAAAFFVSIIIVTYVVQEGQSNWLTGALLIKI